LRDTAAAAATAARRRMPYRRMHLMFAVFEQWEGANWGSRVDRTCEQTAGRRW
jgi:hypothetical protein